MTFKKYRQALLANSNLITVTDFGAGKSFQIK
jgi:hypothetical protein